MKTRPTNARIDFSQRDAAPLTPKQRGALGCLGAKAYRRAITFASTDDLPQKEWIRREARGQVGCTISEASNRHYKKLKAHFAVLAGEAAQAYEAAVTDSTEQEHADTARHLIREHLAKHNTPESYAETICRDRFRTSLKFATASQLSAVLMTVKARMRAKATTSAQGGEQA